MSGEKRNRAIFFETDDSGNLAWPGQEITFVDEHGKPVKQSGAFSREDILRVSFASVLNPRTISQKKPRPDQFALDLIELLLPPETPTRKEQDVYRGALLFGLRHEMENDPDASFFPQTIVLQDAATRLSKQLKKDPKAEQILDFLHRLESAVNDDAVKGLYAQIWCLSYPRPAGSRIDHLTIPLPLIRLYFMLVGAQRELDKHPTHVNKKLKTRDKCPICELAHSSVAKAISATKNIETGNWQLASQDILQMGIGLGTMVVQFEEYKVSVATNHFQRLQGLDTDFNKEYRKKWPQIRERTRVLIAENPGRSKTEIFREVALKLGVSLSTVRRRFKEPE